MSAASTTTAATATTTTTTTVTTATTFKRSFVGIDKWNRRRRRKKTNLKIFESLLTESANS